MRHLATMICSALVSTAALCACAQQPEPIRILAIPEAARNPDRKLAEMPLHVEYAGKIAAGKQIFVRVFRGSPADLKSKYARDLLVGKCVLFTSSARYQAMFDGDGVVRINDVVVFFRNNTGQHSQVLTLVFEEGGEIAPADQLKLSLSGLNTYFDNAMTLTLLAPEQMSRDWEASLAEAHRHARPPQQTAHSSGGLLGWFGVKPVAAKENPAPDNSATPAPGASPPPLLIDGAVVAGPCQNVTPIPLAAEKPTSKSTAATDPVPLRAFAELTPAACGP